MTDCILFPSLMDLHNAIPGIPLVLHGSQGVSDGLFQEIRKHGIVKLNLNRGVREQYTQFVAQNAGRLELTELKTGGVEVYAASIERTMRDSLGSAGKA